MRCDGWGASSRLLFAALVCISGCSNNDYLSSARELDQSGAAEMARAQTLFNQGQADEANAAAQSAQDTLKRARDAYLAARADQSRDVAVLVEFAEFSERLQDHDLAGEAFARAAKIEAERPDLWYRAARNFVEARGRYLDAAGEALDKASQAGASEATAVPRADIEAIRGDLFAAIGLPGEAATHYASALAESPDHARARIGMAGAALQNGDVERSIELAESFEQPTPAEGALLDRTLRAAFLASRRDRVVMPDTAPAQRALAKVCVRLGFMEESLLSIERAVQLDPNDVFSWNMLGSLSAQAGDTQRAREAFTRSLALAPEQPRTKQVLDELGGPI